MDNSEVLDTPEVNAPEDTTVQTQNNMQQPSEVINNMYSEAQRPSKVTGVIGENNHAATLAENALSHADAQQTFDYTSQGQKEYDESVKTTTTQSTGANMTATWDSEMKMSDDYKVNNQEDYSWNKLAKEMASLNYEQEKAQARYESMQTKQEIDQAATEAWNNYFAAEYSARQTQDKMGWSGGQKTASDLQVSFLQAETAANMYTKDEMQKYGVETKLSIARMYAEANQRALALQYYQDAEDQAIKEAEQTGWYVPPEASEMFKQQEMANKILSDPNSTADQINRAKQVNANCQRYYDAKGFQRGYAYDEDGNVVTEYYGIKCLQTLTYEETVRNNKVNEELQREANQISRAGVGAAWASVTLAQQSLDLNMARQNQIDAAYINDQISKKNYSSFDATAGTYSYWDSNSNSLKQGSLSGNTKVYKVDGTDYIKLSDVGKNYYGNDGYIPVSVTQRASTPKQSSSGNGGTNTSEVIANWFKPFP